jgi:RecB family exonuclease/inactivated superfamily I helicase
VIVPSAAAADQLRRTLENHILGQKASSDRAVCLPRILTRGGWYDELHARMPSPPRRLSDLEREVLLKAAARAADSEHSAPFRVRAGLLVQMLAMYDDLRRRNISIETFERLVAGDLQRDADVDRGAERLLRQTRFLAAAFRGYEARLAESGGVDEHALRAQLLRSEPARPMRRVIVTVGERSMDPAGLWPADIDLLTQMPLLEQVDIIATHGTIAAGLFDRIEKLLPGFEEAELPPDGEDDDPAANTAVVKAADGRLFGVSRDREDELGAVARTLKQRGVEGGAALDRRAVVFKRPLPYVYLARDVFADAGIPYQTFDALPLAAEPYAAALDLVFEFVTSEFTREPVVALLSSPHFEFKVDGKRLGRLEIAALNRACSEAGYFGGVEQLRKFAAEARGLHARAARAAASAAEELAPTRFADQRPSAQLAALLAFLLAHDRVPGEAAPLRERHLRARRAIISAIESLRRAHEKLDDGPVDFVEIAAMIRRWIEGQTFAPRAGTSGVQVLDAQAARYGEFDEIFLVGLVEGEWPQRPAKSIFYPASLLSQLDWPDSRVALAGERAAFQDLLRLPRRQVHLSTFELENDAIIAPSVFLEDVERVGLRQVDPPSHASARLFVSEGLAMEPVAPAAVQGEASAWLSMRAGRSEFSGGRFHGAAEAHRPAYYTVSSLERYLECPFRYFSEKVLKLEEDPEDEVAMTPQELGIFVHKVFEAFFSEWTRLGRGGITPENLSDARTVFRTIVEPLLGTLADDEAAVQRTRLLGSAADEGLAEAVFQIEAEWQTPVERRLLEHALTGEFEIQSDGETRRVNLRGKADRIDLLADGTFRIIDYKLTRAPDRKLALQLPIYTICTAQHLLATTGRAWEPGQAGYIAFGGDRRFVPMLGRGKDKEETLRAAQARLLETIDAIERGEFPPRPADTHLCLRCAHVTVCRKDYVGDV